MNRAIFYVNHATHQREHGEAMKRGMEKHGCEVVFGEYNKPQSCDVAILWGWRNTPARNHAQKNNIPLLVMERAYLPNRMQWTSMGWGGLNGRARFPQCQDNGERFNRHWGEYLGPWKSGGKYALVCGQIPGDASLNGLNPDHWASEMAAQLIQAGNRVVFRPHPVHVRRGNGYKVPAKVECSTKLNLEEDLEGAEICVTYNSNSAVEAVCAGVPTITMDEGSMAFDVTSHDLGAEPFRPDRTAWAHRLAWCQWKLNEIASGEAWEAVKRAA